MIEFDVEAAEAGMRLDVALVRRVPGMSRARARTMVEAGEVHVNGRRPRKGARLALADRVALARAPESGEFAARPDADTPLTWAFEDEWLVAVDKPAGMPSHPLRPSELGTVANALVARFPEMAAVGYHLREPGILHRLDTDTSGLMLAARDEATFEALRTALRAGRIDKRYVALVAGRLGETRTIETPIAPHPRDPRRVVTGDDVEGGRPARTVVVSLEAWGACTRVEVSASTATRHQVRAHLASLGHPLVGDTLYGASAWPGLARHFLHASQITFEHPRLGHEVTLQSALPVELAAVLDRAR